MLLPQEGLCERRPFGFLADEVLFAFFIFKQEWVCRQEGMVAEKVFGNSTLFSALVIVPNYVILWIFGRIRGVIDYSKKSNYPLHNFICNL